MTRSEVLRIVKKAREAGRIPNLSEVDLRGVDLCWANLSGANLRWANLSEANLRWVNLSEANLSEANLGGTNLCWANLSGANLSGANLGGTDLSGADLSGADLRKADLSEVDLRGVDLRLTNGKFSTYYGGRNSGWAAGGNIGIGCEKHSYQHWLDHGIEIGKEYKYTDAEIKRYMRWIEDTVEWLTEESAK